MKTAYVEMELKDGILFIIFNPSLKIDMEIAKQIVAERILYIKGKEYSTLIDARSVVTIDKEARDYLSTDEGRIGVKAAAILTGSVFSTFMANFFLSVTVDKPKVPTKLFSDKAKAIKWLQQFAEKSYI